MKIEGDRCADVDPLTKMIIETQSLEFLKKNKSTLLTFFLPPNPTATATAQTAISGRTNDASHRNVRCQSGRTLPRNDEGIKRNCKTSRLILAGEFPEMPLKFGWRVDALLHHKSIHGINGGPESVISR